MIYLASQSPRRAELLAQIGVPFQQFAVDIDETPQVGESPEALVQRLAMEKARAGWQRLTISESELAPVLGSDTVVVCNGEALGKPKDKAEGMAMLQALSQAPHQVLTAVALVDAEGQQVILNTSTVQFRALSEQEKERYWHTGEPADKAGGYGIQGAAAVFIEHISGSYSGVMGLPLYETAQLLARSGVEYWHYE